MTSSFQLPPVDPSTYVRCYDADLNREDPKELGVSKDILDKLGKESLGGGILFESLDGKHFIQIQENKSHLLPEGYKPAAFATVCDKIYKKVHLKDLEGINHNLPLPQEKSHYRTLENIFSNAIAKEQQDTKPLTKVLHLQRFHRLNKAQEFFSVFSSRLPSDGFRFG